MNRHVGSVAADGFRHEALLYAGEAEFVERVSRFVRSSLEQGEPIMVAISSRKIRALRAALGTDGRERVLFADMNELGRNPARIIPAWRDFVTEYANAGRLRGVGEPVWPGRSAAELAECERHELLLNVAFEDGPAWWLVCPYDTAALDAGVIDQALGTHPYESDGGSARPCAAYRGLEAASALLAEPLPQWPPGPCLTLEFESGALAPLRAVVAREAVLAGLDRARVDDLVLAAHEVATNSIRHGGGRGSLHVWREEDTLAVEVRDNGSIADLLAGRRRPPPGDPDGRGLWLSNQLCDLVQIRSSASGSVVRMLMSVRR